MVLIVFLRQTDLPYFVSTDRKKRVCNGCRIFVFVVSLVCCGSPPFSDDSRSGVSQMHLVCPTIQRFHLSRNGVSTTLHSRRRPQQTVRRSAIFFPFCKLSKIYLVFTLLGRGLYVVVPEVVITFRKIESNNNLQ